MVRAGFSGTHSQISASFSSRFFSSGRFSLAAFSRASFAYRLAKSMVACRLMTAASRNLLWPRYSFASRSGSLPISASLAWASLMMLPEPHLEDLLVVGQHHVPGVAEHADRRVPGEYLVLRRHQVPLHAVHRELPPVLVDLLQLLLALVGEEVLVLVVQGLLHPPEGQLRVEGQGVGVGGHVAHQPLLVLDVDGHALQDLLERLGPPGDHGLTFGLFVRLGDEPRPVQADLHLAPVAGVIVYPRLAPVETLNGFDNDILLEIFDRSVHGVPPRVGVQFSV